MPSTMLAGPGEDSTVRHHDGNHMLKIAEPDINPWLKILRQG
ncbi:MAG: hypothetical protein U1E17_06915 [Geminicoccaceae bacterium]